MHVFFFEHVIGGGEAPDEPPAALARQGKAMLRAVAADFLKIGWQITTTCDARQTLDLNGATVIPIHDTDALRTTFERQRQSADAALIIAPESEGQLFKWTRALFNVSLDANPAVARNASIKNLGSDLDAIALCADKLALARHLQAFGVPTPPTALHPDNVTRPAVIKPRYGAGCESTFYVEDATRNACSDDEELVYQPWVKGTAASASLVVNAHGIVPLQAGEQTIEQRGQRLYYTGGRLPLNDAETQRAMRLAEGAARAIPGLRGFVGIDLVLGESAGEDQVIEINPRITMSYPALSALSTTPLARTILDSTDPPHWYDGTYTFTADGTIHWDAYPSACALNP